MTPPWYFILDLGLWALTAAVVASAWPRMGKAWRRSACATALVVMVLQSFNEVLSRKVFQAWTFSYEHNRMIGISLLGEPVEEHLFWWAFAWMIPFGYAGLIAWFRAWDAGRGREAKVTTHE